jgi:hypothetical protein
MSITISDDVEQLISALPVRYLHRIEQPSAAQLKTLSPACRAGVRVPFIVRLHLYSAASATRPVIGMRIGISRRSCGQRTRSDSRASREQSRFLSRASPAAADRA